MLQRRERGRVMMISSTEIAVSSTAQMLKLEDVDSANVERSWSLNGRAVIRRKK
mgnify:CR=1 FL=1